MNSNPLNFSRIKQHWHLLQITFDPNLIRLHFLTLKNLWNLIVFMVALLNPLKNVRFFQLFLKVFIFSECFFADLLCFFPVHVAWTEKKQETSEKKYFEIRSVKIEYLDEKNLKKNKHLCKNSVRRPWKRSSSIGF